MTEQERREWLKKGLENGIFVCCKESPYKEDEVPDGFIIVHEEIESFMKDGEEKHRCLVCGYGVE